MGYSSSVSSHPGIMLRTSKEELASIRVGSNALEKGESIAHPVRGVRGEIWR